LQLNIFFYTLKMAKPLPPLKALRAFETAARLGSFTRAANELGVTSAAVGQQVRSLEAYLHLTLFNRSADGLEQTPLASEALPVLRQGFDRIAEAVRMLNSDAGSTGLRVSVSPTVGMRWLVPRLPRFCKRHPEIEISIDADFHMTNLARGEADIAIRFGHGRYPGLMSERILEEYIFPLCSPQLRDSRNLRGIEDLAGAPLVHVADQSSDTSWPNWRSWAERHGLDGNHFVRGPSFIHSGIGMALQAAVESQGVALSSVVCAIDDIRAGRLVAPFGANGVVQIDYGFDLVFSAALAETRPVAAFRAWAKSEARDTMRLIARVVRPDLQSSAG
jgi:LysR family glycine cleavage system transcriptional activator